MLVPSLERPQPPLKILLGSDYHGQPHLLRQALEWLPKCDGYINCGDFCSQAGRRAKQHGSLGYYPKAQPEIELLHHFWTEVDLLGKPWIFVPGNHDPSPPALELMAGSHGIVATGSRLVSFLGLWALLIPYTPPCGWNWTLRTAHLREWVPFYGEIAQQVRIDLLLSHAPPKGTLDEDGRWYPRRMPTLKPLVDAIQPRYYICGHMHKDGGKQVTHQNTTFINVAERNWILEIPREEDAAKEGIPQAITMPPSTLNT
jgi:Icc-related predicted phosphoesterase